MRGIAVVVTLLTLTVGLAFRPGGTSMPGDPTSVTVGLPRKLHVPPLRTAHVGQSPPGTAAAIFGGTATTDDWNEGRFAVVAAGSDRYRVFNEFTYTAPGFDALLSPDGDLVARNRTVRSLRPDRRVSIALPGDPRAFSPDGTLLVYETGDGTTYIDGVQHRESRIAVYDLTSRSEIASIDNSDNLSAPVVALSRDNSRLAVQVRDQIRLYHLDSPNPAPYAIVALDAETLAGPGAWLPDGRSFVTARRGSDGTWRLVPHNADTGAAQPASPFPNVVDARYLRVIGWRADGAAIAIVAVPRAGALPALLFQDKITWVPYPDSNTARARLVALAPNTFDPTVLLETPDGVSDLDVAADLAISGQFRTSGSPDYGPPSPFFLAAGGVLMLLVGVPLLWLVLRVRRRVTERKARAAPAIG
ncbi:hypothetical protein Drose_37295 [Dactylosporangium roseum]|uniref:Uncharacterized protein n=1 Tax=Dactylosporangium roseum TaxID=47989 RepID=A0ABY5Z6B2_9ACTN|nr:hypothetical protein [Dactylosporangium roseum]UWZ36598.1 hypothetical protein Drose_37295 [Dactylosporangium roseum]